MPGRQPFIPRFWLFTDERMGGMLWHALDAVPRGGGVVFRHYGLPPSERRALYAKVARIARRRRLVLIRAGTSRLGSGESGVHGRAPYRQRGIKSWPAHNRAQVIAGQRADADVIFVSPVFATRSHPGNRPLGKYRALMLKRGVRCPVIALGGMKHRDRHWLGIAGFHGMAGIDLWTRRSTDD